MNQQAIRTESGGGVRQVPAYSIGGTAGPAADWVIEEAALAIVIEGVGNYTLMWTPTEALGVAVGYTHDDGVLADTACPEILALATGFAFTEGIIDQLGDIAHMTVCPDTPGVVRMRLHRPDRVQVRRRDVVMTSSCGVCGGREILEGAIGDVAPVTDTLRLHAHRFERLMARLRRRQAVFLRTGGAHAAAVFTAAGEIVAAAEDLGRHNALDKVIGQCLLLRRPFSGCGVLLSSRLSLELVNKAARAGLELMAAVSAPTSYAIELAERCGITLCGFVRGARANVYTHPRRIRELVPMPTSSASVCHGLGTVPTLQVLR